MHAGSTVHFPLFLFTIRACSFAFLAFCWAEAPPTFASRLASEGLFPPPAATSTTLLKIRNSSRRAEIMEKLFYFEVLIRLCNAYSLEASFCLLITDSIVCRRTKCLLYKSDFLHCLNRTDLFVFHYETSYANDVAFLSLFKFMVL